MVKPQLNLDKKDLKSPDGNLVKVVTGIEEPAPLNPEPYYAPPKPRRRGLACRCFCFVLGLLFIGILILIAIRIFVRRSHGYGFVCGVMYDDYVDIDYGADGYYSDSEFQDGNMLPYGDDMLYPPKPTGPPMQRYLEEGLEIDLNLRIVRISHPGDELFPEVTVLHDFNLNVSAYLSPSSEVCYIRPLNLDSALAPQEFQELIETEAFKNQNFPMVSEVYRVNPETLVYPADVGPHIEDMCSQYGSYYIQQIPSDQWRSFWQSARSVLRDHFGRDGMHRMGERRHDKEEDDMMGDDMGHRRMGMGNRHHDSSSSEESNEERRHRRAIRVSDYVNNLRSFDGQKVSDMHVFDTQRLEGLSSDNLNKLTNLEEVKDDFIP